MADAVEIKKIIVRIGEVELSLLPEQAKELKSVLDDLLGKKETVFFPVYQPPIIYYPVPPIPTAPYYTWSVECDSDTNSLCISSTI